MSLTASDAGGIGAPSTNQHFRASALAHSIRIAPTKRNQQERARVAKRVAIVLRPGMRQDEFRRIDLRRARNNLTSVAVLTGNSRAQTPEAPVCGLIITGSDTVTHPTERHQLEQMVSDARERGVAVLAHSDSAALALAASGLQIDEDEDHLAVLIDGDATWLRTRREVDHAIDALARSPAR